MTLVQRALGPAGSAYLRAYLQSNHEFGKRLGRMLLGAELDFGDTMAFVPADSSEAEWQELERGGIFSRSAKPELTRCSRRAVTDWLGAQLAVSDCVTRLLVTEEALLRRGYPAEDRLGCRVFYCGESVYSYRSADDAERIVLRSGAIWEPSIGIVTPATGALDGIADRRELAVESLEAMAAAAVVVVVGAYDGEGWVLWRAPAVAQPGPT